MKKRTKYKYKQYKHKKTNKTNKNKKVITKILTHAGYA